MVIRKQDFVWTSRKTFCYFYNISDKGEREREREKT